MTTHNQNYLIRDYVLNISHDTCPTHSVDFVKVACPACQVPSDRVWMGNGGPTRYVRCSTCRTIYASLRAPFAARYKWLESTFSVGEKAVQNAQSRQKAIFQERSSLLSHIRGWSFAGHRLRPRGTCFNGFQNRIGTAMEWKLFQRRLNMQRNGTMPRCMLAIYSRLNFQPHISISVTMLDMIYYLDDPKADLLEVKRF